MRTKTRSSSTACLVTMIELTDISSAAHFGRNSMRIALDALQIKVSVDSRGAWCLHRGATTSSDSPLRAIGRAICHPPTCPICSLAARRRALCCPEESG
jgi:hypothetical protein